MIREMKRPDLDAVAAIWLDGNRKAHDFIPPQYWEGNFEAVRKMLPDAELYIYEDGDGIQGFVGLDGDYIAGIFVRSGVQSRGIGKQLMDFVKAVRSRLTLSVYQKNERAAQFYRREGFAVLRERTDKNTGETEYFMGWER